MLKTKSSYFINYKFFIFLSHPSSSSAIDRDEESIKSSVAMTSILLKYLLADSLKNSVSDLYDKYQEMTKYYV